MLSGRFTVDELALLFAIWLVGIQGKLLRGRV